MKKAIILFLLCSNVYSQISSKKIALNHNINKNIIGGFNLKIGDKMIDCTVSSKINNLRKKLINN